MPILPASKEPNRWLICFTIKADGVVKFVKEEFRGTVREAIFQEMHLRNLARFDADTGFSAKSTC
jgi:hypothetical protein